LELAPFSSGGPTRDGRQKPDLLAPGMDILAARSTPVGEVAAGATTRKSGTSMAASHVTGATSWSDDQPLAVSRELQSSL